MYVITGATGNTGKPITLALLEAGKKVRIISRSAEKAKELTDKGAELFVGETSNADFKQSLMGQMGASENVADNYNEFIQAVNEGKISTVKRTKESTTPTTIEEFANTFKYVYNM